MQAPKSNHLKDLLDKIKSNHDNESSFSEIYQMLLDEIKTQSHLDPNRTSSYLNSLLQTQEKAAGNYIMNKDSDSKVKLGLFNTFLEHFESDIFDEIQ